MYMLFFFLNRAAVNLYLIDLYIGPLTFDHLPNCYSVMYNILVIFFLRFHIYS